ncbi:MAG: hypothetical protein ACRD3E_08260 [Terriglobales bacterium]
MAIKDTLEVINRMQADGVIEQYAIGGAVGATFYIEPAATVDLDIFVEFPNAPEARLISLSPIYEYLVSRGCKAEGEYIVVGDWPVQFLPASGDLDREALEHAIETDVDGVRTRVIGPEHLIAIALRTGRSKDRSRIIQFFEQASIDSDKLQRILDKFGLMEKWQKLRARLDE